VALAFREFHSEVVHYPAFHDFLSSSLPAWGRAGWGPLRVLEDASERLHVARIAGLATEQPVLRAPEEIGVQRVPFERPRHRRVVVADQLLGWTTVRCVMFRARRNG